MSYSFFIEFIILSFSSNLQIIALFISLTRELSPFFLCNMLLVESNRDSNKSDLFVLTINFVMFPSLFVLKQAKGHEAKIKNRVRHD